MKTNLYFVCGLFAVLFFVLDITTTLSMADGALYIVVVFLSTWVSKRPFTFALGYLCSILTMIGYLFPHNTFRSSTAVLTDRSLCVVLIWICVFMVSKRIEIEEEFDKEYLTRKELMDKIKILSGFIPICAGCRRIRNENGEWDNFEVYINDHSEATFTHGICPECVTKLYPNDIK